MKIKKTFSPDGLSRKWILELNTEEFEHISAALDCASSCNDMPEDFCIWCRENADKIFKILDS